MGPALTQTTMKKLVLCLILAWVCLSARAQQSFMRWGAIDTKDLAMKVYPADSSASAAILGSFCYTTFNYNEGRFQVSYQYHYRIKILKKEGYQWANVQVPLYTSNGGQSHEKIRDIKGATYNLDPGGSLQKTELGEKSTFSEVVTKRQGERISLTKFALPSIKEGSIIEYSYTVDSDYITILNAWEFQRAIPVRKSEYQIKMIGELGYMSLMQSNLPFTTIPDQKDDQQGGQNEPFRWAQENVPAYVTEPYITTSDDYISKIQFQLMNYTFSGNPRKEVFSTWKKTITELWENFNYGGFVKRKGATKELVSRLVAGQNNEKDKMAAIFSYVKSNFKIKNNSGIYATISPKELMDKREGYKHEINLLLVNMLREADLNASPILLSTRPHGKIFKNYPILERFNHSIAYVKIGEEEFLLDATHPMLPIGMLPAEVLNGEGLLMSNDGNEHRWIDLQNRSKSGKIIVAKLDIAKNGELNGQIQLNLQGYEALQVRQKFANYEHTLSEEEPSSASLQEYELFKDSLTNLHEYDLPLKGKGTYQSQEFTQVGGDRIYLNPMLHYAPKENPLKATERKSPVDFSYPFSTSISMSFTVPEGYVVEEVPKSERIQWEDKAIRFDYLVSVQDNLIQISCRTFVNRAVFAPEEYPNLRESFAKIVAKQNEQIVLKKK